MAATKFSIDPRVFTLLPGLRIAVVVARGFDNTVPLDLSAEFAEQEARLSEELDGVELAQYPIIRAWRDAYKLFGEKHNRCSVEALIRRTVKGKLPPSINPLVDLYNLLSLTYELPYGGENLDVLDDDIMLTFATGDEEFVPLGETEVEHPPVGEIMYRSGKTVLCGSFNYRESDLTKIMPDSRNVVLFIEDVPATGVSEAKVRAAAGALAEGIERFLGGSTQVALLDEACPEIVFA